MKSLHDAAPIMIGYFSISIAFGVIAKDLIGFNAVLMSALVFAGASQFIALHMIMNKSPGSLIVLTTFLINLRHLLMSSYMSRLYKNIKILKRVLISFGITDETFATVYRRFKNGFVDPLYNLKLNILCYISWVSGTVAGLLFGFIIPCELVDVLTFGLTALFITILVLSIDNRIDIAVAALSGSIAILLSSLGSLNILLACLLGCIAGGVIERWRYCR